MSDKFIPVEACYLISHNLIPPEEMHRVFETSYSAPAEIGLEFLCFDEPYQYAARIADKDSVILDFGCGYAAQSYYFTKCKQYIGVDLRMPAPMDGFKNHPNLKPEVRFTPDNATFYIMSIQEFIRKIFPTLAIDRSKIIAVCSAVFDRKARDMVAEYFPLHHISYPGERSDITLPLPDKSLEEALGLTIGHFSYLESDLQTEPDYDEPEL